MDQPIDPSLGLANPLSNEPGARATNPRGTEPARSGLSPTKGTHGDACELGLRFAMPSGFQEVCLLHFCRRTHVLEVPR
jgi:hypothetical protein